MCTSTGEDRRVNTSWEHLRKHGSDHWVKGTGLLPSCVSSVSAGRLLAPWVCVGWGWGSEKARRPSLAQQAS